MKPILITIIAIGIVSFIQDKVVMEQLVPLLVNDSQSIPFSGWALLYAPSFFVCLLLGVLAKSHKEACYMSFSGAVIAMLYAYFSAYRHSIGHSDTWAMNGPVVWWSAGLTLEFIVYFLFMSLGLILYKHYASRSPAI